MLRLVLTNLFVLTLTKIKLVNFLINFCDKKQKFINRKINIYKSFLFQCILLLTKVFYFSDPLKKLWVCFQCGKRYLWRGSLQNHRRVECQKEPTFCCPVCGRKFKHKHRWQSHAKCMHQLDLM